jgi:hypothetical protein
LLNEGDPFNTSHYVLADEFGKYMHQFKPDHHLVTTSFWHSFPKDSFWSNPNYPDVDYADVHLYISESEQTFSDTAQATYTTSMQYGAYRPGGAGKPVIRGETGFVVSGSEPASSLFDDDSGGIWLHNFVWGGINPGGMLESYWYEEEHIYQQNPSGIYRFDLRPIFHTFYNFIRDLPLNNGHYLDAAAQTSIGDLRTWGQKDLANGRAHLWIQNTHHTWVNVVNHVPIPPISGWVSISGFHPGEEYTVQWWDPYQPNPAGQITSTEIVVAQPDGSLVLHVSGLTSDVGVKVLP